MSHRILPQQREVRGIYDAQFDKLKQNCEISQALNTPYKQAMVAENAATKGRSSNVPKARDKEVPLMNTIMEGDYFDNAQQPKQHKFKLSRYEAKRIHFRGFVPEEELRVTVKDHKKSDPMSKEARKQALRRVSTPNFVQENKRILRKMSDTVKSARSHRPQSAQPTASPGGLSLRDQYNDSRPSTRRGESRPQSARAGLSTQRRSIASQPLDFGSPRAQQEIFVGQSANSPAQVRYQPTYRHAEIITTCERAQWQDSMNTSQRRAASQVSNHRSRPMSGSSRKTLPDYNSKARTAKQNISGFSINTKGALAARPQERKARIENRTSRDTASYYNFKDNVRKYRETEPEPHQIKMAIHSPAV